jgi:hypothetical protein
MSSKHVMIIGIMGLGTIALAMLAEIYFPRPSVETPADRAAQAEIPPLTITPHLTIGDHTDATVACHADQNGIMTCAGVGWTVTSKPQTYVPQLPYCDEVHTTNPEISVLCAMRDQAIFFPHDCITCVDGGVTTPIPPPHCDDGYELVLQVPSMRPMCACDVKEPK